jgi:hypothetical protein
VLDGTKGAWEIFSVEDPFSPDHAHPIANNDLMDQLSKTHTNTYEWDLMFPGDYPRLVEFLEATKHFLVDGKQLQIWLNLVGPIDVCTALANPAKTGDDPRDAKCREGDVDPNDFACSLPEESPITPWSEANFFKRGLGIGSCKDLLGWASLTGRLAQDYPQLVAVEMDDFFRSNIYSPDFVAEFQSRMRSQAPWLNLVPTVYYADFQNNYQRDAALTFDTMLFWFRNEKQGAGPCLAPFCVWGPNVKEKTGGCLAGVCAEPTVANAPGEFSDMAGLLPKERKLQGGVYFGGHSALGEPSPRYDYDLTTLILEFALAWWSDGLCSPPLLPWRMHTKAATGATVYANVAPGQMQRIGQLDVQTLHSSESVWE